MPLINVSHLTYDLSVQPQFFAILDCSAKEGSLVNDLTLDSELTDRLI